MKQKKMRKIFLALPIIAIVACAKIQPGTDLLDSIDTPTLTFKIEVNHSPDGKSTKAVKQDFVEGDIVYVFFEDVTASKYLTLTKQNNGTWASSVQGGLLATDLSSSGKNMYCVFFPFGNVSIISDGGDGVFFRDAVTGQAIYTYYMTASSAYTLSLVSGDYTLSGTLDLSIPENFVQFFMDKDGESFCEDRRYRLAIQGVKPVACGSYSGGVFTEVIKVKGQPIWGYHYADNGTDPKASGEGVLFSGVIEPSLWSSPQNHRMLLFDTHAAAKTKVFSGKTLSSHAAIKISTSSGWAQALETPGIIDFGVYYPDYAKGKYADRNLGAVNVEDYGFMFAWGEIVPYCTDDFRPDGDEWCMKNEDPKVFERITYYWGGANNYDDKFSKYVAHNDVYDYLLPGYSLDNKMSLDPEDDAATAWLGPNWRMPTYSDLCNIYDRPDNTDWTVINGVNCKKFQYLGEAVYLPVGPGNNACQYWSASRNKPQNSESINTLSFSKTSANIAYWSRYAGLVIRPVYIGE